MSVENAYMINSEFILRAKRAWIFMFMLCLGIGMMGMWAFSPEPADRQSVSITLKPSNFDKLAPKKVATHTVAKLEEKFLRIGYNIDGVKENGAEVPRVSADSVPHDMNSIQVVSKRKDLFVSMMLPLVLIANERLEAERANLIEIIARKKSGNGISDSERRWLDGKFKAYRVKDGSLEGLLTRLDVVPPSLAVAQAAIESGWGTSRFAREGNALFGQWTWGEEGIVPEAREEEKTHKIKAFQTPLDSVTSYIKNLNTHRAYRKLRNLRQIARKNSAPMDGNHLAIALTAYSEKGMEYVELVRSIIRVNDLQNLDAARLASGNTTPSNA